MYQVLEKGVQKFQGQQAECLAYAIKYYGGDLTMSEALAIGVSIIPV